MAAVPAIAARFGAAQPVYERKIATFARRNFRALPGCEQQDLEAELLEVLWLACLRYDPDQGATFNTFYWECAKRRFLDLHKAASAQKRVGDYQRVFLSDEAVALAVDNFVQEHSAESEVLAKLEVREQYRSGRKIPK